MVEDSPMIFSHIDLCLTYNDDQVLFLLLHFLFVCLLVLFCFVLFCFVLFCFVLFCFVLFCFVLFCFVLFCFVLFCFVFVLFLFLFLFLFCFVTHLSISFSLFPFFFSFLFFSKIITVNLTMDKLVKVSEGGDLPFTYSVRYGFIHVVNICISVNGLFFLFILFFLSFFKRWEKSEIAFNDRFSVYMDMPFFEHQVFLNPISLLLPTSFLLVSLCCEEYSTSPSQIHWFSILNSFMMLTFLVGFVGMILVRFSLSLH